MTIQDLPLESLVEDQSIYPRNKIDPYHVSSLVLALKAGATFDPPVVTSDGYRIVDGFHRVNALRKFLGPDATISVEVREYSSPAEVIEDAVRRNSRHGRKFDQQDRIRSALLLRSAGVSSERIAVVMMVPPEHVKLLLTYTVVQDGRMLIPAKILARPVMPTTEPRNISAEQAAIMRSASGRNPAQTIRQLTAEIRSGVLPPDRMERIAPLLWELYVTIEECVPRSVAV